MEERSHINSVLPMSMMINPSGIFLLLCHSSTLLLVAAQKGFLSIDCGVPDGSTYTSDIRVDYVSDNEFIDSGVNKQIDAALKNIPKIYQTLRCFPDYQRNCYALPVEKGTNYLVRAYFMHGNYDGVPASNAALSFDLYLGVDFWESIKLDNATHMYWAEFGSRANTTTMSVCLVKTTAAVPFISALELRPLRLPERTRNLLYKNFTDSASFTTFMRVDLGATAEIRYPDDPLDRIWRPDNGSYGNPISTKELVKEERETFFGLPSAVMQTAANPSGPIVVTWPGGSDATYHMAMHFAELQKNGRRNLTLKKNGDTWSDWFYPEYLNSNSLYSTQPVHEASYTFSVEQESGYMYSSGPILNAFEVFKVVQPSGSATQIQDADAINGIKDFYGIKRNWKADPCLPQNYPWDGLTCSYENSSAPRIVSLDLSSSRLHGPISSHLAQLTALRKLPPIVHRDVKTTNILLDSNLEAKLADFGLSKTGIKDDITHMSTAVAGTPGYIDPEYYNTSKLTEKSDVYSFGVVLSELITGRHAIFALGSNRVHILQWVTPKIVRGELASIVDPRLQGSYDTVSMWKVADTALSCTADKAIARPTMTEVVNELMEAMNIEAHRVKRNPSIGSMPRSASLSGGADQNLDSVVYPSAR
ncbi:Macrophage colony-stimulating factor 1 receptor [Nymphaea thermarum]|nr:Macrophage colony-stimulating factor 1 receptor [Nymphaea thermarum]